MNNTSSETRYRIAMRCSVVAAVFSAVVAALLANDFTKRGAKHPFEEAAYLAIKAVSVEQPNNEAIKRQLTELDTAIRQKYFRQRIFTSVGAGLLALGFGLFVLMAKAAATARRELPHPTSPPTAEDREAQTKATARLAVGVVAVVIAATAVGLVVRQRTLLPEKIDEIVALAKPLDQSPAKPDGEGAQGTTSTQEKPPAENPTQHVDTPTATTQEQPAPTNTVPDGANPQPVATNTDPGGTAVNTAASEPLPSDEELAKNWPRFRGPGGTGVSAYDNIPMKWDAASGEGIAWKTEVPLPGNGSPVVWGERVFLSGADETKREVFCFDAAKGTLLWRQEAPGTPESTAAPPKLNAETGYAASTTACDGRRVYAIFANGDLAAFSVDGKLAWAKSLGMPINAYGHASSLMTWKHLLIVQLDQGHEAKDKKSRLLAFESATGKPAWETVREVPNSWASPILIHAADRDQIITAASPWCMAYDPADGKEIWRFKCLAQDVGPSPTFADGLVYAVNTSPRLTAIRPDGEGDVTKTHGVWVGEDNLPDTCSPLATKDYVFLVSLSTLICYDAKQGDMLWDMEIEGEYDASPGLAGGKIYLADRKSGKCLIIEPSKTEGKIVGESELGEPCVTSPAFQDGRIYLRGKKHLFCIGKSQ